MLPQADTMTIAIKPEQCQALSDMARQEGQELEMFIAQILQEAIDKQQAAPTFAKIPRIRRHRNAFLAKRKNIPLTVDTVALLQTLREEHDEYLLAHITT